MSCSNQAARAKSRTSAADEALGAWGASAAKPVLTKQDLAVVGYGSLMSGSGLLAVRRDGKNELRAKDAFPVLIRNGRRGLAKPSSHGDYLAMDIEPTHAGKPLRARIGLTPRPGELGALGLVFERASAGAIARREEYSAAKLIELIALADRAGRSLGDFLRRISEAAGDRPLQYRRALYELLNYTSQGYIFHPLRFDEGFTAIIAVGSGFEGSGAPHVVSRRRACGMDRLLTLGEALEGRKGNAVDRRAQVGYFVECLLGAWHGLDLSDLVARLGLGGAPARELSDALCRASCDERAHFLTATSLDEQRYSERFCARRPRFLSSLVGYATAVRHDGQNRGV